jgi:hypothetical protein
MALPPWSPYLPKAQAACPQWRDPKEACQGAASQVCWLPVWLMTKLPWQGKETKANHEVFIATKPGECISVDQITSTEVGFYAQLKGKLTKKR